MTDTRIEEAPPPSKPPRRRRYRALAIVLGVALALQLAVVLAAPYWAPPLLPLLPWGKALDTKLSQRIHRLETGFDQARQAEAQHAAAVDQLGRRIGAVEKKQEQQQQAAAKEPQLETRIAALEQRQKQEQQEAIDAGSRLKQIEDRLAKVEGRPEASAQDIAESRQRLETLSLTEAGLAGRVQSLEKAARTAAADPTNAALVLSLLQIREAIDGGRPFPAEYDAFAALARDQPEIGQAAAPLAEGARAGVANRTVLAQRLHDLAGSIANARTAPAEPDWSSAALARLRGLVTVRRLDGAGQSGPEPAVNGAEAALASGDLADAIAALGKLTGAPGEAAQPWLRMAGQRLAVEQALRQIQALLVARLGKNAAPGAASGPPG